MDLLTYIVDNRLIVFDCIDRRDHRRNTDLNGGLGGMSELRKNDEEEE
jgi:hypothetical protein